MTCKSLVISMLLVGFLINGVYCNKEKLEKLSNNDRVMEMDGGSKYMDGGFN